MMKQIGGRTGASFRIGISSLSAHVIVHLQLMCESGMALTGPRGVTLSMLIWT
jgi:hypothetical protein